VNVKPVMELQDRLDDMEFDMEDLKEELQKAKEECAQKSGSAPAAEESNATVPASEPAPSVQQERSVEPAAEPADLQKPAEANGSVAPTYRESKPAEMNYSAPVPIPTFSISLRKRASSSFPKRWCRDVSWSIE